jgi:hypothetical protein
MFFRNIGMLQPDANVMDGNAIGVESDAECVVFQHY